MMHCNFVFKNLNWNNRNNIDQQSDREGKKRDAGYGFLGDFPFRMWEEKRMSFHFPSQRSPCWSISFYCRQFFNEFEFDAVSSIMFLVMTSMTFHFKKIYEIFVLRFFDFFVRNLVFLISFFTIFASFFFIFRFASIDRTLHIIIFTDVIDIWLSIKNKFFLTLFESKSRAFFLSKKIFVCSNFRVSFFNFLRKKKCRNDFVISFCENANATHAKDWSISDIFQKIQTIVSLIFRYALSVYRLIHWIFV